MRVNAKVYIPVLCSRLGSGIECFRIFMLASDTLSAASFRRLPATVLYGWPLAEVGIHSDSVILTFAAVLIQVIYIRANLS